MGIISITFLLLFYFVFEGFYPIKAEYVYPSSNYSSNQSPCLGFSSAENRGNIAFNVCLVLKGLLDKFPTAYFKTFLVLFLKT